MRGSWGRGGAPYGNKGRFTRERNPLWQTQIQQSTSINYDCAAVTYDDEEIEYDGKQIYSP